MSLSRFFKRSEGKNSSDESPASANKQSTQGNSGAASRFDSLLQQYISSNAANANDDSATTERNIPLASNHWQDFLKTRERPKDPQLDPMRNIGAQVFVQIESLAKEMGIYRDNFFGREWFHTVRQRKISSEHCLGEGIPWESILQEMQAHGTRAQQELAATYIHQMQSLDLDFRKIEHSRLREHEQGRDMGFDR